MTSPGRDVVQHPTPMPADASLDLASLDLASLDLANLDYANSGMANTQYATRPVELSNAYSPAPKFTGQVHWWQNVTWRSWIPPTDWILSFAIHASVLVVLAFISLEATPGLLQSLIVAEASDDALSDLDLANSLSSSDITSMALGSDALEVTSDIALEQLEVELPSYASESIPDGTSASTERAIAEINQQSMTAGRTGKAKLALLSRYGGTERTEAAVKLGLEWLLKQQTDSGAWSFVGPYTQAARFGENQMAATSMALLAFLGAGHTHKSGPYQKQIRAGFEWIVAQQKEDGNLGSGTPIHHAI